MQNPQEIFDRIAEKKKKLKDLRTMLEDVYGQSSDYVEAREKKKTINEKIKQIKLALNSGLQKELEEIDSLKTDIASDNELLKDMLLNSYLKGEAIEIKDEFHQPQLPIFSVKFVKE